MQHYLMLSRGNFYAKKQHNNKVLPLGIKGSSNYPSQLLLSVIFFRLSWEFDRCFDLVFSPIEILL